MNWVDIVIMLLIVAAGYGGWRLGLLRQLGVFSGIFGGLFLAGWLLPHILPVHDRTVFTLINANLVLLAAIYGGVRGYDWGYHWHYRLLRGRGGRVEMVLGIIVGPLAMLILIWLLAAGFGRLPFERFSNSVNDALIVQSLDLRLPAVPAVFASFDHIINPNNPSSLVLQAQPPPQLAIVSNELPAAAQMAGASTVRITSFGCGGVVSGSGFIIGPGLVATNAHVIAGVKRPIVKTQDRSYQGVPVQFSASLDFAVLRVAGLSGTPLRLAAQDFGGELPVAVIGYPGGNYHSLPGLIRDNQTIFGRNIYQLGNFGRDVYEIQTAAEQGSSGGPVIAHDGEVVGMIFAQSQDVPNDAFALTSASLYQRVQRAQTETRRVSTGACLR